MCVMREDVARELNIRWKHANWKRITANGNQCDLMRMAESVPVNDHGIVIPVPIQLANLGPNRLCWVAPANRRSNEADEPG